MQKLWIYGAGGHATVVADMIASMKNFDIIGFIDDDIRKKGNNLCGYTIIGNLQKFRDVSKNINGTNMFIAIGNNLTREKLSVLLADFKFPTIIHHSAIISKEVEIDCGTIVMPGAIIEAQVKIGQHCIINNHTVVGHGSIVEDFCHISGGVVLGGQTRVEKCTLIGIGSCITQKIQIGKNCIIGAGSIITKNVPDDTFMFGNPARVISNYLKNS